MSQRHRPVRAWQVVAALTVVVLVAWVVQLLLAPRLLVATAAGLQTALQALPATFLALLALGFGAVFVVVQQAAATLTTRSGVLLLRDGRIRGLVGVTLVLAAATLMLAGQVPDSTSTCDVLTATVSTLMLAAAGLVVGYAVLIPRVVTDHTLPSAVVDRLLAEVDASLGSRRADDALAGLAEIERHALMRHDEATYELCITGVTERLWRHETLASERNVATPLARHVADVAEAAIATDGPLFEADVLRAVLKPSAEACVDVGLEGLASRLIVAFARLGTRTAPPARAANVPATAGALAEFAAYAKDNDRGSVAATGLTLWAMARVVAERIDPESAQEVEATRPDLGADPPYAIALQVVEDPGWKVAWPDVDADNVRDALRPPWR